jgi:hypothetical protein
VTVSTGVITSLVKGYSICNSRGDGGFAIDAEICYPKGVAVDEIGDVYIADSFSHKIRKFAQNFAPTAAPIGASTPSPTKLPIAAVTGLFTDEIVVLYI